MASPWDDLSGAASTLWGAASNDVSNLGNAWDATVQSANAPGSSPLWQAGVNIADAAKNRIANIPAGFEQGPVSGIAGVAGLPFEVVPAAWRYAAGVGTGVLQAMNPETANQAVDVTQRAGTLPGSGLQELYQAGDFQGAKRVLPPVGNILDPREATQRGTAITPPVLSAGVDIAGGGLGMGAVGDLAKSAGVASPIGKALASTVMGENGILPRAVAQGVQNALDTRAGQIINAAVGAVATVGGAGLGISEMPQVDPDTGQPYEGAKKYLTMAEYAGSGAFVGGALLYGGAGGFAKAVATSGAIKGLVRVPATASPLLAEIIDTTNRAKVYTAQGADPMAIMYPGGALPYLMQRVRAEMTDRFAYLKDIQGFVGARVESGISADEATSRLVDVQQRLAQTHGNLATSLQAISQAQDAVNQSRVGAINARMARNAVGQTRATATDPFLWDSLDQAYTQAQAQRTLAKRDLARVTDTHTDLLSQKNTLAQHEALLTGAVSRPNVPLADHELPGMLAQLTAGIDGEKIAYTNEAHAHALNYQRDPANPAVTWGLQAGDHADFDTFLTGMAMADRVVNHGFRHGPIQTPADAQLALQELKNTLGTEKFLQFNNTLQKLTDIHNQTAQKAVDVGLLSQQSLNDMMSGKAAQKQTAAFGNPFYLSVHDVEQALQDWRTSTVPANRPLLVSEAPFGRVESGNTLRVTLQDQLDRDTKLLTLINQQKVGQAMQGAMQADPTGFGMIFQHYTPEAVAEAEAKSDLKNTWIGKTKSTMLQRDQASSALTKAQTAERTAQARLNDWTTRQSAGSITPAVIAKKQAYWQNQLQVRGVVRATAEQAYSDAVNTFKVSQSATKSARRVSNQAAAQAAKATDVSQLPVPHGTALWPVYENGVPQMYLVPQDLHDVASGINEPQANVMTKIMGSVIGNVWRNFVTGLSVPFMIRNIGKDFQTAIQNYPDTGLFLSHYVQALGDVLYNEFGLQTSKTLLEFINQRGPQGAALWSGAKLRAVQDLLDKTSTAQYEANRGAMSTFGEQFKRYAPGAQGGLTGGIGTLISAPGDLLSKISTLSELPTRVAIYKAEIARGASAEQAAYMARTVTVDFSKSGQSMRVLNAFMPLLNARVQGQLNSAQALRDDPSGYIMRTTATGVIPALIAYAWNRRQYGDLLDQIAPQTTSLPVIVGKYFDPNVGQEEPIYVKFPLDDASTEITLPLRFMLDEAYHTTTDQGQPLTPEQRTQRPIERVFDAMLANIIPSGPSEQQVASGDPFSLLWSFISMAPLVGTFEQLWANKDNFTGDPVYDPDGYLVDGKYLQKTNTSLLAKAASQFLHEKGLTRGYVAPPAVDTVIQGFLPSLGAAPYANAMDGLLWSMGYRPPTALSPQDLGLPPDASAPERLAKFLTWQKQNDPRPWLAQMLPQIVGAGGAAQSALAKSKEASPEAYARMQATQELQHRMNEADAYTFDPKREEIFQGGPNKDWSQAKILSEALSLQKERQGHMAGLAQALPGAITDPTERQKFYVSLPGTPIGSDYSMAILALPPGTNVQALAQSYLNPPGVDLTQMNAAQQQQVRDTYLSTTARMLSAQSGHPVSPEVLRAAVSAVQSGVTIPSLPVPATYMDLWTNRYMSPPDYDPKKNTPTQLGMMRNEELFKIVHENDLVNVFTQQGMIDAQSKTPELDAEQIVLKGIIRPRLTPLGPQDATQIDMERALALSARIHDPRAYPDFVGADGEPVGTPSDWTQWTEELAVARAKKQTWNTESPHIRLLDMLQRYARANKINNLYNDPDYDSYDRFFKTGRNLSSTDWERLQSGEVGKFYNQTTHQFVDPNTSRQLDYMYQYWAALPPNDPRKAQFRPMAQRIQHAVVPGYLNLLNLDALNPDSVLSDQDVQAQDALYAQQQ